MHSLIRSTTGGRGGVLEFRDGTRKSDKLLITLSQICIQPTTSWLVHIQEHVGARTSHGRLWIHKTHHSPDLGEAITFPYIVFSAPTSKWLFVPRLPRRSPETVPVWTPATLRAYNFLLRPPIGVRSEANL